MTAELGKVIIDTTKRRREFHRNCSAFMPGMGQCKCMSKKLLQIDCTNRTLMMLTKAHLSQPGHVFYSGSFDLLKNYYAGNFLQQKNEDTEEKNFCSSKYVPFYNGSFFPL